MHVLQEDLRETSDLGAFRGRLRRGWLLWNFAWQGLLSRTDGARRRSRSELLHGLGQDVRLAFRSARRRPVFVLLAVVSLSVGIGANAALFSLVDALLLRDIPGVQEPDLILQLGVTHERRDGWENWSYPDFESVRDEVPLEAVAFFELGPVTLSDGDGGQRLLALYSSAQYFDVFGITPALGRTFAPGEDARPGPNLVALLSHQAWMTRFEGDPGILGRTIQLNREPFTIIGVTPENFRGHTFGSQPSVYLPITQERGARADPERRFRSRGTIWGGVVARRAHQTDIEEVDAALATVFARLAEEYPDTNAGRSARAGRAGLAPADARPMMAVVFGIVGSLMILVLAATCANVGGMMLAHAATREREMAVRAALGSGRARIIRHLLAEALLVFVVGGAGGVFLARRLLPLLDVNRVVPTPFPVTLELSLDWRLTAFGAVLTLLTGMVFGLLPAFQATRGDVASTLRDGTGHTGRQASKLRRLFVGGQVAVSLLLLSSAALFVRSARLGDSLDPGFDPSGLHATTLDLTLEGYRDPAAANAFVGRVLDELRAMPEVAGAAMGTDLPADGGTSSTPVYLDEIPEDFAGGIQSHFGYVTEGYFETLGIPVRAGRTFSNEDGPGTDRVAIVNQTLAQRAWPGESPVGRTIVFGLEPESYTIAGVVGDTKSDLVTDRQMPQVFGYLPQGSMPNVHVVVRQRGVSPDFVERVRRTVQSVDPALGLSPTRSLAQLSDLATLPHRIAGWIASSLGLLALLLSALGLYGVVALVVSQQTREIGVRIVLGARRRRVVVEVLRGGLRLALPGLLLGSGLALAFAQLLEGSFIFVSPVDPISHVGVALLLLAVVLIASWVPARRAANLEPVEALRRD